MSDKPDSNTSSFKKTLITAATIATAAIGFLNENSKKYFLGKTNQEVKAIVINTAGVQDEIILKENYQFKVKTLDNEKCIIYLDDNLEAIIPTTEYITIAMVNKDTYTRITGSYVALDKGRLGLPFFVNLRSGPTDNYDNVVAKLSPGDNVLGDMDDYRNYKNNHDKKDTSERSIKIEVNITEDGVETENKGIYDDDSFIPCWKVSDNGEVEDYFIHGGLVEGHDIGWMKDVKKVISGLTDEEIGLE